jgi:hypothetical protein
VLEGGDEEGRKIESSANIPIHSGPAFHSLRAYSVFALTCGCLFTVLQFERASCNSNMSYARELAAELAAAKDR